jgi:hypothetical protein
VPASRRGGMSGRRLQLGPVSAISGVPGAWCGR